MAKLLDNPESLLIEDGNLPFKLEGWIDTAPFEDLIGIELVQVGGGEAILDCQARVKLTQGGGVVHGGVLTALADTAVAMAIKSLLPEGTVFATTELQMRFLTPVRSGRIRAYAEVCSSEERTYYGRATLYDASDVEVALFTSVFRVARNQPFVVDEKPE
jgi:uncharacterized protein (TIGR00369 family)